MSEERAHYMAWRPATGADQGSPIRFRENPSCDWELGTLIGIEAANPRQNKPAKFLCRNRRGIFAIDFGDCEVEYDRNALP